MASYRSGGGRLYLDAVPWELISLEVGTRQKPVYGYDGSGFEIRMHQQTVPDPMVVMTVAMPEQQLYEMVKYSSSGPVIDGMEPGKPLSIRYEDGRGVLVPLSIERSQSARSFERLMYELRIEGSLEWKRTPSMWMQTYYSSGTSSNSTYYDKSMKWNSVEPWAGSPPMKSTPVSDKKWLDDRIKKTRALAKI